MKNSGDRGDGWADAALLLVGHGSSRIPASRTTTERLAREVAAQGRFAEVRACFWKEDPMVALDLVAARRVFVVPNFAGDGIFTRELIPKRLGLSGLRTCLDGREVIYTAPVGCHPGIAGLLKRRALVHCRSHGIAPAKTAILVIGHGSRRPGMVSTTPAEVAARLAADAVFAEVRVAYIEQDPAVGDWPALVSAPVVLAQPLLVSEGMHASEDLPPVFGLTTPTGGPVQVAGRTVWLMDGIGRDRQVVAMILDQVRDAERRAASAPPPIQEPAVVGASGEAPEGAKDGQR